MSLEVELGTEINNLKNAKKKASDLLEEIENKIKLRECDLKNLLIEEGKDSTGHINGAGEFSLKRKVYPGVNKADKPNFLAWVKAIGEGAMIKEEIPPGTLTAWLKEKIDELVDHIEGARAVNPARLRGFISDVWPRAAFQFMNMADDDLLNTPAVDLAKDVMKLYWTNVYTEIGLSHTGKGK